MLCATVYGGPASGPWSLVRPRSPFSWPSTGAEAGGRGSRRWPKGGRVQLDPVGLCIQCAGQREQEEGPDPGPLIPSPSLKSLPGTEVGGSQSGQLQLQPRNPERLAWGRVTCAAGVLPAPSVRLQTNPRSTAPFLLLSSGLRPLGRTLQSAHWLSSLPSDLVLLCHA